MRLVDYFAARQEAGVSLTAAVRELSGITGAGERSVWRWVDGGEVPLYAKRLLVIWSECTPEQRQRWFGE